MFEIPKNLPDLTAEALKRLIGEASAEYDLVFAAASANDGINVTEEQLSTLEALNAFSVAATQHLETLTASAGDGDGGDAVDPNPPMIGDIAPANVNDDPSMAGAGDVGPFLLASAGSHGHNSGERITYADAAQMLHDQINSVSGGTGKIPLCVAKLPDTEFTVTGARSDIEIVNAACAAYEAERATELKSITASGWCAPSPTDYEVPFVGEVYDLATFPSVQAPRGGVYVMPELDFTTVYGGYTGTNFFNYTEAQIIAGVTKTFVEMGCPSPTDYRLGVSGFGVIGNLLQLKAFPEYCDQFLREVQVAFDHYTNVLQLAAVSAGSTQVDLTAAYPFVSDGSLWSQLISAVGLGARDIRALKRFKNRRLDCKMPNWVIDQVRADLVRRQGKGYPTISDAEFFAEFAKIGVDVELVAGYQDAFASGGTGVGQATPLTTLPNTLKFLIYPTGTWVRAQLDVIKLSTIYDATRLAANQRIEGFFETGWRMVKRLSTSREYEIDYCPNGAVGAQHTIACSQS